MMSAEVDIAKDNLKWLMAGESSCSISTRMDDLISQAAFRVSNTPTARYRERPYPNIWQSAGE